MTEIDSKTMINGIGNDLKIAVDDLIGAIIKLQDDVKELKFKTAKPDKTTSMALLEYLAMEEGEAKKNLEILCGEEIKQHFKWLEKYCEENHCTQEQALKEIINGEI